VEHLAALRAIPTLNVYRPADATETAECWAMALATKETPSILALSRQNLPSLRSAYTQENLCAYGAYVMCEHSAENPQVTLIGTGSEVMLCVEAAKQLKDKGIAARVVSMPCQELFLQQPESYQREVLGDGPRVAVEAAIGFGWERFAQGFIGMPGFGASAPAEELYKLFGITAEAVAEKAASLVA
jgi:transketolase